MVKNNRGSALYYVMVMMIVVTLILSATLYASYKNALLSTNYSNDEESFNKCDGALEALRGQLAARLYGKSFPESGISSMIGNNTASDIFIFKSASHNGDFIYYLSIGAADDTYFSINKCLGDDEGSAVEFIAGEYPLGYIVERVEINDSGGNWQSTRIVIKDVTVRCKDVEITSDIVINIDVKNVAVLTDDVFAAVEFENYSVKTVSVDPSGGDG